MKKIKKDEFLNGFSKYYNSQIIRQVGKLKVNEAISIDFNEWEGNIPLQDTIRTYGIRSGKKFRSRQDKYSKVWLFLRVK